MSLSKWIKRILGSHLRVDTGGTLTFESSLVARKLSQNGTESIRTKDSLGNSSEADIDSDGNITSTIRGRAPQGEEDGLHAATILVDHLNLKAKLWAPPQSDDQPERGVDWVSESDGDRLLIQVTRIPDQGSWRELARTGAVYTEHHVTDAVHQLRAAIEGKASIQPRLRGAITLAIDAVKFPAIATLPVVSAFKMAHAAYVKSLGFHSMWVIGPAANTVYRLDGTDHQCAA